MASVSGIRGVVGKSLIPEVLAKYSEVSATFVKLVVKMLVPK